MTRVIHPDEVDLRSRSPRPRHHARASLPPQCRPCRLGPAASSNTERIAAADPGASRFDDLIERYAAADDVPIEPRPRRRPGREQLATRRCAGLPARSGRCRSSCRRRAAWAIPAPPRRSTSRQTNIRYGMKYPGKARKLAGGDLCGTILKHNGGHACQAHEQGPARRLRQGPPAHRHRIDIELALTDGLRPPLLRRGPTRRTIPHRSSGPAGRTTAAAGSKGRRGGKSGLHGNTVPDNARRGRPQGKCHRKQTARQPSRHAG